ncbi:MAG: hypothetical protein DI551_10245 [Micavibrio aeruginosavorus]|uniref:Uncharacterized protein n=1 Tax=Micavibrio aeruginosavorus TaxID=349221 RepID=A0A2W5MU98_9BACT|nr:MAG: hypothetical protein DI551_10245 [Micavibrio aeruginosavorus]
MKKLMLATLLACLSMPAMAEDVQIIRREGDRVQNLPGNAQIVTNPNRGPTGVIIYNNDDSLLYRTLVGRRNNIYMPNAATSGGVASACPPDLSVSERNRCVRDVIKAQEKIREKYN